MPRVSAVTGLKGGFLAWAAVVVSGLVRRWWSTSSRRHPHWSSAGPELLTVEVVRTGVALLGVLLLVAPLALWAAVLPVWFLAAVTAGVAGALPVGLAVGLRRANADAAVADPGRLWAVGVALVAAVALVLSLVAALAGLAPWSRALAWAGTAVGALGVTAWVRGSRWVEGSR